MLKEVVGKLAEATEHQSELRTDPIPVRPAGLLLDLCEIHGVPQADGSIELNCVVTQAELARRTGCTREVANKHLRALGDHAVETRRGHIRLRCLPKLRQMIARGY